LSLAPGLLPPLGKCRNIVPERIGIELIATVQQQVKGIFRMLRRQVQPALVALPPAGPEVLHLRPITCHVGYPKGTRGRQMNVPAVISHPVLVTARRAACQ